MALTDLKPTASPGSTTGRPSDDELDYYGATDRGKVRPDNQDQFLIGTVHQQVVVHGSSLGDLNALPLRGRLGSIGLVADGVGGAAAGDEAARIATESVMRYVSSTLRCYHTAGSSGDEEFFKALREAALQAHDAVRAEAASRPDSPRMATTLTLVIGVWPWMYVVQVGDSRCYRFLDGVLTQVTSDQTVARQLVDQGAMREDQMQRSPLRHVLASAIGADEATPVVTRVDLKHKGGVTLLCTDGLTKHVTDDEIRDCLQRMTSSKQAVEDLIKLALDRGGSDNVTVLVARTRPKTQS